MQGKDPILTTPYSHLKQLEAKYEDEKRRCLSELESVRKVWISRWLGAGDDLLAMPTEAQYSCPHMQRATDKEAAIQKAATKQIDSLTMQLDQLQEQLQQRIREISDLGKNSQSSVQDLLDALQKAKQETEEAIQAGNRKYNDMLANSMRTEDQLQAEVKEVRPCVCVHPHLRGHEET